MSEFHIERQRRAKRVREQLRADGQALLGQIKEAIAEKLPGSEVVINPERVMSRSTGAALDAAPPMLAIDGYPVELTIEQYHSRHWPNYSERLAVGVNWIWVDMKIRQSRKSFGHSSKTRKKSFGFDVAKIAEYILFWVGEKKRHEAQSEVEKRKKEQAASSKKQWELALRRIEQKHAIPGNVSVEATPGGLKAIFLTDERQLDALLTEFYGLSQEGAGD